MAALVIYSDWDGFMRVLFNDFKEGVWHAEQMQMQGYTVETAVRWKR